MFYSALDFISVKKANRYYSYKIDPYFTFLVKISLFLSFFFLIPVVVEIVYELALLDIDT